MKLKFKNQKFQTDAAKAVTDVFKQQRRSDMLTRTVTMILRYNATKNRGNRPYDSTDL